jgi:amidophosphoribosyltransferase
MTIEHASLPLPAAPSCRDANPETLDEYLMDDDAVKDACGVFGIFAPGFDVARLSFFGIFALQHRGQESAGIAVTNGEDITLHRDMGLVSQVFTEEALSALPGFAAIAHARYSTTGSSLLCNAQPIMVETAFGPLALAHNGNLVNTQVLRRELEAYGICFEGSSDSEVAARLIAFESHNKDSLLTLFAPHHSV